MPDCTCGQGIGMHIAPCPNAHYRESNYEDCPQCGMSVEIVNGHYADHFPEETAGSICIMGNRPTRRTRLQSPLDTSAVDAAVVKRMEHELAQAINEAVAAEERAAKLEAERDALRAEVQNIAAACLTLAEHNRNRRFYEVATAFEAFAETIKKGAHRA